MRVFVEYHIIWSAYNFIHFVPRQTLSHHCKYIYIKCKKSMNWIRPKFLLVFHDSLYTKRVKLSILAFVMIFYIQPFRFDFLTNFPIDTISFFCLRFHFPTIVSEELLQLRKFVSFLMNVNFNIFKTSSQV